MKIHYHIASIASILFFVPVGFALAQGAGADFTNLTIFIEGVARAVGILIPIAFALILLFFFWALAKYVFGDAEDKEKAKNLMIWGVIALFVAASIWGLVAFLQQVFGIQDQDQRNPAVDQTRGLIM